jgi:hypothetical protein
MKYAAWIIALLLSTTGAYATPVQQANYAMRLFSDICAKNIGQETKSTAAWLKKQGLKRIDLHAEGEMLRLRPGTVWAITNKVGNYFVVLTDPYQCSIWAHQVDVLQLKNNFATVMDGLSSDDVKLEKVADEDSKARVGTYQQSGYMMKQEGAEGGVLFLLGTNPDDGEIQARITASPVAADSTKNK